MPKLFHLRCSPRPASESSAGADIFVTRFQQLRPAWDIDLMDIETTDIETTTREVSPLPARGPDLHEPSRPAGSGHPRRRRLPAASSGGGGPSPRAAHRALTLPATQVTGHCTSRANFACHPGDRSLHISLTSSDGSVCATVMTGDAVRPFARTLDGGALSTAAAHAIPPFSTGAHSAPTRHRLHLGHFHRHAPIWETAAEPWR